MPPSDVIGAFYGVVAQERIVHRFLLTAGECLATGVMITPSGIAGGGVMQRYTLLRRACEIWAAAPSRPSGLDSIRRR